MRSVVVSREQTWARLALGRCVAMPAMGCCTVAVLRGPAPLRRWTALWPHPSTMRPVSAPPQPAIGISVAPGCSAERASAPGWWPWHSPAAMDSSC